MSSEELVPHQIALADRDRSDSTVVGDNIAISVRNVGKMYYLYGRPQDRLKQAFLWGRKKLYREFWALWDVSFEVKRGETVGIIGRNGAGKSTLLQIIAGTLAPTTGEVRVNGRVAALLELGAGFNPEFTGRENVFMSGAILGISRKEIEERFDEIAAFADIGDFIDQPVRVYSNGMRLRLAFAVQAIVAPDVLIVDEVLAVGDEAFQRKCMATLENFQLAGGTVLFVSHNTQAIVRLCQRCLLFDAGWLLMTGESKKVTDVYQRILYGSEQQRQETLALLRAAAESGTQPDFERADLAGERVESSEIGLPSVPEADFDEDMVRPVETVYGNGWAEIFKFGMYDDHDRLVNVLVLGERYRWRYRVRFFHDAESVRLGMMFKTIDGLDVAGVSNVHQGSPIGHVSAGAIIEVEFDLQMNVAPGTYFLNSGVSALLDGEEIYLHRRVDLYAVRVVPRDQWDIYGVAFLEPRVTWRRVLSGSVARG